MPRVSKVKQKETDKGLAFLAELIGKPKEEMQAAVEDISPKEHEIAMLQAEGVLLHIYNINRTMLTKYCKECKEVFSTRYQAVAYCSNLCRRKAMLKIGIVYDVRTDHYENIGAERPIVVSPEVHAVVVAAARRILEDQNILIQEEEVHPQETPTLPEGLPDFLQESVASFVSASPNGQYQDALQTSPDLSLPESIDPSPLDLDFPSPF